MKIKMGRTGRGFVTGNFQDRYRTECSIQESSLATEAAIWLGIDGPKISVLKDGKWVEFGPDDLFPEEAADGNVSLNGRMHLTVDMAKTLIPLLQHFVETGELPAPGE